ncbi:MAG TPA: MFS transporter [Blastocatellia bacterium]|nr:MFS transporter [Blastocatellia bacterium]
MPANARVNAAGYCASFVALGLIVSSLGPTLHGLAQNTRSTLGGASILFAARATGYFAGALVGGRLFDRFRGHPVLAAVLLVMAVCMSSVPFVSVLGLLAVVMLAIGITEGMLDVGANTLIVWSVRERVGPYLNSLHFFFAVGAFLAPIVVARAIAGTGGIAWAYWILAIYLVPAAAWIALMPSPPAWIREQAPQPGDTGRQRPYGRLLALIVTFYVVYIGAESSFSGWIYSYAFEMHLENATGAAYLTSVFWGSLAVGRLIAIPFAARFRPRHILVVALVAACACITGVLLVPDSVWVLRAGSAGTGLAMAAVFPTMLTLAGRHLPITGKLNSTIFAGASGGSIVFPWLIGQLFEPLGPRSVMVVIVSAAAGSLLLLGAILAAIEERERADQST